MNFSHHFNGVVWNMIAWPQADCLILEVRNLAEKKVSFSALNYKSSEFLWRDRILEESWWVNLTLVADGIVVFTIYLDTNNPDKKGVLAYSLNNLDLLWWNNDFSVAALVGNELRGFSARLGLKETSLDLHTGQAVQPSPAAPAEGVPGLRKPVQYAEGTDYFETVKTFLSKQLNLDAVSTLEYLETESVVVISCYVRNPDQADLANFLLVLSREGEALLKEAIDLRVKGIGLDTFFVLDNVLFFVKNKTELVSYTIL